MTMSNAAAITLCACRAQFATDAAFDMAEWEEPLTESTDDTMRAAVMTYDHFFVIGQYFEHTAVSDATGEPTENAHIGDALGTIV